MASEGCCCRSCLLINKTSCFYIYRCLSLFHAQFIKSPKSCFLTEEEILTSVLFEEQVEDFYRSPARETSKRSVYILPEPAAELCPPAHKEQNIRNPSAILFSPAVFFLSFLSCGFVSANCSESWRQMLLSSSSSS